MLSLSPSRQLAAYVGCREVPVKTRMRWKVRLWSAEHVNIHVKVPSITCLGMSLSGTSTLCAKP